MRNLLIFIFIFSVFLNCSEKQSDVKKSNDNDELIKFLETMILTPNYEYTVLISKKYNIDETLINNVIRAYLKYGYEINTDSNPQQDITKKNILKGKKLSELISKLSFEYNISTSKIANIIYNYKILSTNEEEVY